MQTISVADEAMAATMHVVDVEAAPAEADEGIAVIDTLVAFRSPPIEFHNTNYPTNIVGQ